MKGSKLNCMFKIISTYISRKNFHDIGYNIQELKDIDFVMRKSTNFRSQTRLINPHLFWNVLQFTFFVFDCLRILRFSRIILYYNCR